MSNRFEVVLLISNSLKIAKYQWLALFSGAQSMLRAVFEHFGRF